MARSKKTPSAGVAADLENFAKNAPQIDLNGIEQLVNCCMIPSEKLRKQSVEEVLKQYTSLRKMLDSNPKLLQAEVERTLLKLVTGYTVTESTKRISGGRAFLETRTKHIPPNQRALEYWLNNRAADKWSSSPDSGDTDALAKLDEILKGVRTNATDGKAK